MQEKNKKVPDIINLCMANDKRSGPTDRINDKTQGLFTKGNTYAKIFALNKYK